MRSVKWLLVALMCCASGLLHAQYYYQPGQQYRAPAQTPGPAMVLRHGLQKLLSFASREEMAGPEETMLFLEKEISPYFDFEYMSQWVSGGNWSRMPMAQRQQMTAQLQKMFLTALSQKLSKYGGQGFKVMRPRSRQGGEVTVPVAIQNPGGYPSRLIFRFYRSGEGGWKVFDVSANGSSALVYYRQYFNQQMRQAPQRRMLAPR